MPESVYVWGGELLDGSRGHEAQEGEVMGVTEGCGGGGAVRLSGSV